MDNKLQDDIQIALLNLLQIREIEVRIGDKWITGEEALSHPYKELMNGLFRKKESEGCEPCQK